MVSMKSEIKSLLKDAGYKSQRELAEKIFEENSESYKSLEAVKVYLSQTINGTRGPSEKLIQDLKKNGINTNEFLEIINLTSKKVPNEMKSSLEKELNDNYNLFEKTFVNKKDIYVQMKMLLDFNEVVKKYVKGE